MSKSFLISEEEKNRILSLHKSATSREYLSEQQEVKKGVPGDPYEYMKKDGKYFFKNVKNGETNWTSANERQSNHIKSKIFNQNLSTDKRIKKIVDNNIKIMPGFSPDFKDKINFENLKIDDTTKNFCKPTDTECAQFINDISTDINFVGNAWEAYSMDTKIGPTIYSSFNGIDANNIKNIIKYWQEIDKRQGNQKWIKNGPLSNEILQIVDSLVPKTYNGPKLKPGDIVGIYYTGSKNHERAFYEGAKAGKGWFVNGKPGNTIKKGGGWGMNTHIGRVGVVKDGVPLIFHNVDGTTKSDPPQNLRIAWVKRK